MAPIIFSRTVTLAAPAASITLPSIPQSAKDLLIFARVRFDANTVNDQYVGLRINGDASSVYRANASFATTAGLTSAIVGDGFNTSELILGHVNEDQAGTAGMFATFQASIMRYAQAEPHAVNATGIFVFDDGNTDSEYRRVMAGGYHNDAVAVTSLELMNEAADPFAVGSELTVIGFAQTGDAAVVSRAAAAGTVLDFQGPTILDYTASAGANNFTATSLVLGRTLLVRITGGDGTTTIGLPAGTESLGSGYVAGDDAWLSITCVDESLPQFIAQIRDVA